MPAVIIPAHNEKNVIERCLGSLQRSSCFDDLEIIVVCNGCTDDTAEICRNHPSAPTVIETDIPSKSNALNMGDDAASSFPRMYLDADIELLPGSLESTFETLSGEVHASAPRPVFDTSGSSILVRMFYTAWKNVPYFNDSMIGSGVYAMDRQGRERFGEFPPIIADDGFVRLLFEENERKAVGNGGFVVKAPRGVHELVSIKSRVLAGAVELKREFPDMQSRDETSRAQFIGCVLRKPHLMPCFAVYLMIKRAIRKQFLAKKKAGLLKTWDRDESSRNAL